MSRIPASDIVSTGADGLTRKVAADLEYTMLNRTRQPTPFIPDLQPDAKLLVDQQAARELTWQRAVEDYKPERGGPQSLAEFERRKRAEHEAPSLTPASPTPRPAEAFDVAKAARRILDDVGSPMWDLHDKTLP